MTSLAAVSLSIGPSVRVSVGLSCFRGVFSGRSASVSRSSARVTGFCASILYAVTAIHDYDTFRKLQNVWFFKLYYL